MKKYRVRTMLGIFGMVALLLPGVVMIARGEEKPKPAPAAPIRMATVDMQELFKQFHGTRTMEREIGVDQAQAQKDGNERLARSKALEANLEKFRKQLEDPAINESKKQTLYREWQAGRQEFIAVERERAEFVQRKTRALNEMMILRRKGILDQIRSIVEEHAKLDNFDCVFDRSGLSSTQVPFMIYTKDATDITDILLKRINRDAPADTSVTNAATNESPKTGK